MARTSYHKFQVQKSPQGFAEMLVAWGLAHVVSDLLYRAYDEQIANQVMLEAQHSHIQIVLPEPLRVAMIDQHSATLAPAAAIATQKTKLPDGIRAVDYEAEKEKTNRFYEALKAGQDSEAFNYDWHVYRAINPASLPGYNSLMADWFTVRASPQALRIIFDLFASPINDYDVAIQRWKDLDKQMGWGIKPDATNQQLYNPDSGKGQNRTKASALSGGNVKSFWLVEWLKAVGFYYGAITRTMRGSKDRKTLVIAPQKLIWGEHRAVLDDFLGSMPSETSIKFDIVAILRYTRALLNYQLQPQGRRRINIRHHLVSGFHTAFYKDMGNAVATMNLSFIGLPGWVGIDTEADIPPFLDVLDELDKLTRQFDETHGDAEGLLRSLRDFVSGDDLRAFLAFAVTYASYLMSQRAAGKYAFIMSPELIERIVLAMNNKFSAIADRERYFGFHNIAAAIASSTIWAQHAKTKGDTTYEIRYGLHRELARQAHTPQKFLKAVAAFVHTYNAESMRARELGKKPVRGLVSAGDLDNFVQMLDEYDSQMLAELLLAYGATFSKFVRQDNATEQNGDE